MFFKFHTKIRYIPYICTTHLRICYEDFAENRSYRSRSGTRRGCCKCRSYQKKNRRPLIGTEWQLIQLDGRAVKPEEGKFYVMFLAEENRFAGVGACNRLMGKYETTDKGALRIGPIASTMMACPGMEQEDAFTKALEATTHYDMDGPMLLLLGDGELKAVFQAKP